MVVITIRERLVRLVRHVAIQLDVNESDVHDHLRFIDDLGADSLAIVELTLAIEDDFEIEIPDDVAHSCLTVGDAVQALESAWVEKGRDPQAVRLVAPPTPPSTARPETGPIQFGDDWPGVFLRGDNATAYAIILREVLYRRTGIRPTDTMQAYEVEALKALLVDLETCDQRNAVPKVRLKPWGDCQS